MREFALDWAIPIAIGIGGFALGFYFPVTAPLSMFGLFIWLIVLLARERRRNK